MIRDAPDRIGHLEAFKFGEKSYVSEIDAQNRDFAGMDKFRCTQNRAVSAENDNDFRVVINLRDRFGELRGGDIIDDRNIESCATQLVHRFGHHGSAFTQPGMSHHNSASPRRHMPPLSE